MANLLTYNQSSVENGLSGFSTDQSNLITGDVQATMDRTTADFWEGTASLHFNTGPISSGSSGVEIVPGVSIPAGSSVTISFYFKTTGAGGALRVHDYTNNGGPAGITLTTPQSVWTRVTYTFTQTPATSDLRFAIRSSTQNQDFWIDGLQVEIGAAATAWVAGTIGVHEWSGSGESILQSTAVYAGAASLSGNATATLTTTATYQASAAFSDSASVLVLGVVPTPEARGLLVTFAGQDVTDLVDEFTIKVQSVLAQGAGVGAGGSGQATTCSFNIMLGPVSTAKGAGDTIIGPSLVRQGEVIIYDVTGARVFGGYATKLDDATPLHQLDPVTLVSCHDYWQHLDRVQINEVYTGQSDTAIIRALLTKYAPWIDQSLIPNVDNYVFSKKFLRAKTLREAIQGIADTTGYMVWVDPYKRLHYTSPSSASTAPFDLSDDPNFINSFPHVITKYEQDDNAIINRVYFYGGRNASPDFNQDLSVQANGNNTTFALLYFPHDASDGSIHVIKNSVELAVGSVFDTSASGKLKSAGGTSDVLLNRDAETLIFDVAPLKTDTLICRYRYMTPLVLVLSSTKSHQKFGDWYDGKIVDQNVFDTNTALQRSRVLLAEQSFGLVTLAATTWKSGLQAGQLVYIKNQIRGLDNTYIVQRVTLKPMGGGAFEYNLDLGAWNWNLVDLLIWQARNADGSDDNTEENMSIIQAQEIVDSSIAAIAFTRTVRTSGQYYSRTTAVGDGHDAFSGFFSITS